MINNECDRVAFDDQKSDNAYGIKENLLKICDGISKNENLEKSKELEKIVEKVTDIFKNEGSKMVGQLRKVENTVTMHIDGEYGTPRQVLKRISQKGHSNVEELNIYLAMQNIIRPFMRQNGTDGPSKDALLYKTNTVKIDGEDTVPLDDSNNTVPSLIMPSDMVAMTMAVWMHIFGTNNGKEYNLMGSANALNENVLSTRFLTVGKFKVYNKQFTKQLPYFL